MHRYVEFYKRSEYFFNGTFVDEQEINVTIEPEGYIRVKGNCYLNVEGIHRGEVVVEEVDRLSNNTFSSVIRVTQVGCIDNTFTGSIRAVTSGGAPIPVNRRLFGVSTDLQRNIPLRKQEEVGISSSDNAIYLSIRDARASKLAITDFATVEGDPMTFQIRDIYEAGVNLFLIQLVYKR
jgi:hypothetical protein